MKEQRESGREHEIAVARCGDVHKAPTNRPSPRADPARDREKKKPANISKTTLSEEKTASLESAPRCPHEIAPGCSVLRLLTVVVPVLRRETFFAPFESKLSQLFFRMRIDSNRDHSK